MNNPRIIQYQKVLKLNKHKYKDTNRCNNESVKNIAKKVKLLARKMDKMGKT